MRHVNGHNSALAAGGRLTKSHSRSTLRPKPLRVTGDLSSINVKKLRKRDAAINDRTRCCGKEKRRLAKRDQLIIHHSALIIWAAKFPRCTGPPGCVP